MSDDRREFEYEQRERSQRGPESEMETIKNIRQRAHAARLMYVELINEGFQEEEALHLVAALGV